MQRFERHSDHRWKSRALILAFPVALAFAGCSSKATTTESAAGGSAELKGGIPAHSESDGGTAGHGHGHGHSGGNGHAGHGGGGMHDHDGAVDEDSDGGSDESGDTDDSADETDESAETGTAGSPD
jgi:hypothetical protein